MQALPRCSAPAQQAKTNRRHRPKGKGVAAGSTRRQLFSVSVFVPGATFLLPPPPAKQGQCIDCACVQLNWFHMQYNALDASITPFTACQ